MQLKVSGSEYIGQKIVLIRHQLEIKNFGILRLVCNFGASILRTFFIAHLAKSKIMLLKSIFDLSSFNKIFYQVELLNYVT